MAVAEAFVTVRPDMKGFAGSLKAGLGKAAGAAAAAGAGLAAAFVGAGVAAFKVGETFDDAFDTIRVGTGATGDALEDLQGSFRNVAKEVPADFGDVSTAVADLNTRLGLTGGPLEELSGQFLDLARITGGDVASQIAKGTRVFGDWSIATEDQSEALDKMFRAAQASGSSVDDLMGQVVAFGSPLRAMGFSLDEATALFGKFEKEGVNAELVIGSLRQGLGKMARAGEDAPETFRRVIDEITNMESRTEATAAAMELFGARAGPDMAAAIQEGRFELDSMMAAITDGSDTVAKAANDTADFGESWQQFKNNVLLGLEPIATRVFDTVGAKMEGFATWWQENGPAVTAKVGEIGDKLVEFGGKIKTWWDETAKPALTEFVDAVQLHWPKVESIIGSIGETLGAVGQIFATEMGSWAGSAEEGTGSIEEDVGNLLTAIQGLAKTMSTVATGVSSSWGIIAGAVKGNAGQVEQGVDKLTDGALSRFKAKAAEVRDSVVQSFGSIAAGFYTQSAKIGSRIGEVILWFVRLPGRIKGAVGNLGSLLSDAGRQVIAGLIGGIQEKFESVRRTLTNLTSRIPGWKGPESVDRDLLRGPAFTIMEGFADDLWRAAGAHVQPALAGITSDMASVAGRVGPRPSSAGVGPTVIVQGSLIHQRELDGLVGRHMQKFDRRNGRGGNRLGL